METRYRNVVWKGEHAEGESQLSGAGRWCRFSGNLKMMVIHLACESQIEGAAEAIWALQDGYGQPGFTPPQGWDWSGIRDSSRDARKAMYAKAKELLGLVPIRWVPGLGNEEMGIIWHPDCFQRMNDERRFGMRLGTPLLKWDTLFTKWPEGWTCDHCQNEKAPRYEDAEASPLAEIPVDRKKTGQQREDELRAAFDDGRGVVREEPLRASKVYEGMRDPAQPDTAGDLIVLVNGQVLSPKPSQKLFNHSPDGWNWGYGGSGPAQLALGILLDYLGDGERAIALHQQFKSHFVARWPQGGTWKVTGAEIDEWLDLQA